MEREPVAIKVTIDVTQDIDNEQTSEQFSWEGQGEKFQLGDNFYISYQENRTAEWADVRIKLASNQDVSIQRKTAQNKWIMPFVFERETFIYYPVNEVQSIELVGYLSDVQHEQTEKNSGEINIQYMLYQNGGTLGKYRIALQYRPEIV